MTGMIFDINHNPEGLKAHSQAFKPGSNKRRSTSTKFKRKVTVGCVMSVGKVMDEITRDMVFYDQSSGGVTFSGGEPMAQIDFLEALLRECKRLHIHTALDTSGYAFSSILS
jgi:pyruvate formate lyase activating enzyme